MRIEARSRPVLVGEFFDIGSERVGENEPATRDVAAAANQRRLDFAVADQTIKSASADSEAADGIFNSKPFWLNTRNCWLLEGHR